MWLDELPQDVCQRLAVHVSGGRQTASVLCLARSSPKQRQAVLSSFCNEIEITLSDTQDTDGALWALVFIPGACAVRFRRIESGAMDEYVLFSVFTSRTVRSVTIYYEEVFLRMASLSQSLEELEVLIDAVAPDKRLHDMLFATLAALKLKKLTLVCQEGYSSNCRFKDPGFCSPTSPSVIAGCSNLLAVNIVCSCNEGNHPIWRLLPALPLVNELVIYENPPESTLLKLSLVDSVKIVGVPNSSELVASLGSSVTELIRPGGFSEAHELSVLAECPRLSKLVLEIKKGAEAVLPDILTNVNGLRTLRVSWDEPNVRDRDWKSAFYRDCCYTKTTPRVMLRTIEAAQSLVDLRLEHVRIDEEELLAILRSVGSRLKHFATSIADQDDKPFHRLERVLTTIAEYNPEIAAVNLTEGLPKVSLPLNREEMDEVAQLAQQRERMCAALAQMQRRSPSLDVSWITTILGVI